VMAKKKENINFGGFRSARAKVGRKRKFSAANENEPASAALAGEGGDTRHLSGTKCGKDVLAMKDGVKIATWIRVQAPKKSNRLYAGMEKRKDEEKPNGRMTGQRGEGLAKRSFSGKPTESRRKVWKT